MRAAASAIRFVPAGRYRMAHALARFAPLPFLMRLPAALGASTFQCDIRDTVAREVCFTGCYEPQETQLAARVLGRGMTAVDVGANWGYFTLAAAHWVGASGRVIAFEPEPRLFAMLESNVARNGLRQVAARRMAVAATRGRVRLAAYDEREGNWGTSHVSTDGALACDAVALDDQLDAERVATVDLVKIDVEGAEEDVLSGMRRGLESQRYRYVLLECHPDALAARGSSTAASVAPLFDAGYRAWTIVHTPEVHRLAAMRTLPLTRLLHSFTPEPASGSWPHFVFAAPGAPDLA